MARGVLGAWVSLVTGALGHAAAGGELPGAGWFLAACGALTVTGVAVVLVARRPPFAATAVLLGLVQTGLHLAFHYATADRHPAVPHLHAEPAAAPALAPGMTLAHGLGWLVAALCLAHGERLLRRLPALLTRPFPRRLPPPRPARTPRRTPLPPPPVVLPAPHGEVLARSVARRGPPAPLPA